MASLYELKGEYFILMEMMSDPDVDEQAVKDTLEAIDGEIEVKAENYAKVIRELEATIDVIEKEMKRLSDKVSKLKANVKRLKETLYLTMKQTGKTKFKTDLFSFSIQKNGGATPVIVDVDTSELPDDLVIISEKPDLKAIGEYLKTHPDSTIAHFGERGESLRIK